MKMADTASAMQEQEGGGAATPSAQASTAMPGQVANWRHMIRSSVRDYQYLEQGHQQIYMSFLGTILFNVPCHFSLRA